MLYFWNSPGNGNNNNNDSADVVAPGTPASNNAAGTVVTGTTIVDCGLSSMDNSSVRLNSSTVLDNSMVDPNLSVLSNNGRQMEVRRVTIKKAATANSGELQCEVLFKDSSRHSLVLSGLDSFLNSELIRGAMRELNIVDVQATEEFVSKLALIKKERLIGINLRMVNVDFVGLSAPSFRTLFNNILLPRQIELHDTQLPFYVTASSLFKLVAVQISLSLSISPSVHIAMDPSYPIDHIDPEVILEYLHQGTASVMRCLHIVDKHLEMGVKAFVKQVIKKFVKDRLIPVYELTIMCSGIYSQKEMPEMQCIRNSKTGQWLKLDAADKSLYAEYPHYLNFFVLKLKREAVTDY